MKKYLSVLALGLVTLLSACVKSNANNLKIVSPTGAPAVAFYNFADSDNYTTNSTPANIVAMMTKDGPDVVVIDGISGIKALKNNAPYKYLATITFGNFYVAKTGNDDDNTLNDGDNVLIFGQGQTPDILFNRIYNNLNLNKSYVANVNQASTCLCSGKNLDNQDLDYVVIAQPILQKILGDKTCATANKNGIYADLQEKYQEANNNAKVIQASIFVKNSLDKDVVMDFATTLKNDIEKAIKNPELIQEGFSKVDADVATSKFGIAAQMAINVLKNNNGLGLGFEYGKDLKQDFQLFLEYFNEEMYSDNLVFDYES